MAQGTINISTPDESIDLRALADWFRSDETLRRGMRLIDKPFEPGHMGGMIEAITISVGAGGVANTLVRYLFTWLGKHGERHRARLTLKDETGREVSLDINGLHDSDALARKVLEFFPDGE
jgi:Effector Associated Constant Component 1